MKSSSKWIQRRVQEHVFRIHRCQSCQIAQNNTKQHIPRVSISALTKRKHVHWFLACFFFNQLSFYIIMATKASHLKKHLCSLFKKLSQKWIHTSVDQQLFSCTPMWHIQHGNYASMKHSQFSLDTKSKIIVVLQATFLDTWTLWQLQTESHKKWLERCFVGKKLHFKNENEPAAFFLFECEGICLKESWLYHCGHF